MKEYDMGAIVVIRSMQDNGKGDCKFLTTKGARCNNRVEEGFSACHAHLIMLFGKDYKND